MQKRRVVITGLGIISSIGIGKDEFWANLIKGKSGISKIEAFDTSGYPTQYGGEINNFQSDKFINKHEISLLGRATQLSIAASKLGLKDSNLRRLEKKFSAKIVARGSKVLLKGDSEELDQLEQVLSALISLLKRNGGVTENDIDTVIDLVRNHGAGEKKKNDSDKDSDFRVILFANKGPIKPRSQGQARYMKLIVDNDIVFAIGPAGTGKTYLAVACAVAQLQAKEIDRIILVRPAVEAGESLGFLPGDLRDKIDPYLRPLYDALNDMLPVDMMRRYLEKGIVEIVPLAYMRGRTLNHAFVILDEAQNSSTMQMKMFLTRLGIGSKAIVTGDITQIDLATSSESGLLQIQEIVKGIDGIEFIYLTERDVVRHRLVREIIRAYDQYGARKNNNIENKK